MATWWCGLVLGLVLVVMVVQGLDGAGWLDLAMLFGLVLVLVLALALAGAQ